jgi:large subunit ribosomal protein L17
MRHAYFGRKLSRTKNERRRLFQNLERSLLIHGSVTTTLAKAKAFQPIIEKLITKAKSGTNAALIQIRKELVDRESVQLLLADAKTRFNGRNSGYTSIVKLGKRQSDASEMALIRFVDAKIEKSAIVATEKKEKVTGTKEKTVKKTEKTKVITKKKESGKPRKK